MQAVATEQELSDFLKNTEKRAFKRTLYHVRNEESALDILQDSMIKLATHYGDKPAEELPMLFQRILSNTTLDWFRRQKTRNALFSNKGDFGTDAEGENFDFLENLGGSVIPEWAKVPRTKPTENRFFTKLRRKFKNCPRVNVKPSCCVIGRR